MSGSALQNLRTISPEVFTEPLRHSMILEGMLSAYFENIVKPFPTVQDQIATLCCVDSRWHPGLVLGENVGASYGIRNIANLASWSGDFDPETMPMQMLETTAALEYIISVKKVPEILVMGHTDCGGAEAHVTGGAPEFVQEWVDQLPVEDAEMRKETAAKLKEFHSNAYEALRRGVEEGCLHHTVDAITAMPFAEDAIKRSQLSIGAIIGDMHNGRLKMYVDGKHEMKALQDLLKRFSEFKDGAFGPEGTMHDLVKNGQHPEALIITGISPYLSPEKLFNVQAGDSFIYRNLGGRYNYTGDADGLTAAIQFAIEAKGVKEIIHVGSIGDVNRDYVTGELDKFKYVSAFIERSTPGIREMREKGGDPIEAQILSVENTFRSIENHPSVRNAGEKVSRTSIIKDHEGGRLFSLEPEGGAFVSIEMR